MERALAVQDKFFVFIHLVEIFFLKAIVLCLLQFSAHALAQNLDLKMVRPDFYSVEVESTRSHDKPRIVNTWAYVIHNGDKYRALMPAEIIRGSSARLDFRWAFGATIAGESEKVELQWKWKNDPLWITKLLGEGFRDPRSGHLILSATDLFWGDERAGQIEMRFLIQDDSGQIVQDGGPGSILKIQVDSRSIVPVLKFNSDWKTSLTGELFEGEAFDLEYDVGRLANQFHPQLSAEAPWCLFAKIQFDEGPVQNYPLLASNREHPEKVIGLIPTVQIPEGVRKMSVWFFSIQNSSSHFDSNFGQNYHFTIKRR